jgi:hypothetical protein
VKTNSWVKRETIRDGGRELVGRVARAVVLLVALGCGKTHASDAASVTGSTGLAHGVGAPVDFRFDSLDEQPVSAEATRGKPLVLTFVTTSNLAAQAQVDFLVAMARHDGDRVNYAVVALEQHDNRELVELYKKALSIPFPVALADAQTLAGRGVFGDVSAVPVTVVLDRLGRVAWRVDGRVARSQELRAALRGLPTRSEVR